ncbi:MAG: S1C family serine protease [Acidobacteriota bacterium]
MRNLARIFTWTAAVVFAAGGMSQALSTPEEQSISAHKRIAASVVMILARGEEKPQAAGSVISAAAGTGFAIEPGLIVTNYHVVEHASRVDVVLPRGEHASSVLVGTAPTFDIALLRVPFDDNYLPPVEMGRSDELEIGQQVLAMGHPFGLQHTVTSGIVSGLNRELPGLEIGPALIQIDAAVNPGMSGGPVVDSDGHVVGVTVAKATEAEAIGFAIPIGVVQHILPDLKAMGHVFRPQIGLTAAGISQDLSRLLDLPADEGILVQEIEPDGVAATAGLRAGHRHVELGGERFILGGDMIVAMNGIRIRRPGDFVLAMLGTRPGEVVSLVVVNDTGKRSVNIEIPSMKH